MPLLVDWPPLDEDWPRRAVSHHPEPFICEGQAGILSQFIEFDVGEFAMRSRVTFQLQRILEQTHEAKSLQAMSFAKALAPGAQTTSRPDVPDGFSAHDYAIFLLHVAAEIEHGLLIQYLFAAYSLGGPQVPEVHRDEVARWQRIILGVAREEMGHLITVQNLLKLLGGPLNLERDDFPWDLPFYPFPFALEPLSLKLLARYVCIESPQKWPDRWVGRKADIEKLAFPGGASDFKRVGVIYAILKSLLGDKKQIPDALFHADTLSFQASFAEWGRGYAKGARGAVEKGAETPDVLIMTAHSRSTALQALDAIAEQGEAATDDVKDPSPSHFERFMELFLAMEEAGSTWSPCRQVIPNPRAVGDPGAVPGTNYIDNDTSRAWARLLNLRYRMLLAYVAHSFRISGDYGPSDGLTRGAVLNRAFGEMYNLRALANILVTLPAGDPAKPERAAPSFELPYSMALPVLERDAWRQHVDLLQASEALIARLRGSAGKGADSFLESLAALDAQAINVFETAMQRSSAPGLAYGVGGRA